MVFARPKKELVETDGSGVILNIGWFREDPGDDPEKQPDFHGQALISVQSIDDVTPELIEEAIARTYREAERTLAPPKEAPRATRDMLGKVYEADAILERVQQRRAAAKDGRS